MNIKNMSNNAQFKDITKISHRRLKIQVDQIDRDNSDNPYLFSPLSINHPIKIKNSFKEKVGFMEVDNKLGGMFSEIFGKNTIYLKKNKNKGLLSMSKIPEKIRKFNIVSKSNPNNNMEDLTNGKYNTVTLNIGNLF